MTDYFYTGSHQAFRGLRAEGVKRQANGCYTILLCTGEVLVDVRRESLSTREEAAEIIFAEMAVTEVAA